MPLDAPVITTAAAASLRRAMRHRPSDVGGWARPERRLIDAVSDRLAGLLLLECHRHVAIGREAHLVTLDVGDETEIDEVVVALVAVRAAVGFGQLDPAAFNPVDGADM